MVCQGLPWGVRNVAEWARPQCVADQLSHVPRSNCLGIYPINNEMSSKHQGPNLPSCCCCCCFCASKALRSRTMAWRTLVVCAALCVVSTLAQDTGVPPALDVDSSCLPDTLLRNISQVLWMPAPTQVYLGSPSLVRTATGAILVCSVLELTSCAGLLVTGGARCRPATTTSGQGRSGGPGMARSTAVPTTATRGSTPPRRWASTGARYSCGGARCTPLVCPGTTLAV